ncbi:MAG: metal-dependent hydrolase [Chloroflexi bacterium]|nr:metal-dependent hydrolase [Chloroflexota bacterium]
MSWATHDLEPYIIQRHLGRWVSFSAVLIGSWGPDVFTKWFVYGISIGGLELQAGDPSDFHRSWPGAGFTHSLAFGVAVAAVVFLLTRSRMWSLGLMVGIWAHALSDVLDTKGTMLLFPFSTMRIHFDAWAYAGEAGRFLDAAAYFSSLGFAWDGFWLAMVLLNWRVLTLDYFRAEVLPRDPFWKLVGKVFPESAQLVLYRGAFFYGTTRWIAWLIWAHVLHSYAFDLSWGGPFWITGAT